MTPKIPANCKPDSTITLGYSGGMALYVSNWGSVQMLFTVAHNKIIAGLTGYYTNPSN